MNCAICGKPTTSEDPWERMTSPEFNVTVFRSEHQACCDVAKGTIGERTRAVLIERVNALFERLGPLNVTHATAQ